MPKYHIQSVQTSRYIINTTCDVPEQVVVTIDGSKGPPSPDNAVGVSHPLEEELADGVFRS